MGLVRDISKRGKKERQLFRYKLPVSSRSEENPYSVWLSVRPVEIPHAYANGAHGTDIEGLNSRSHLDVCELGRTPMPKTSSDISEVILWSLSGGMGLST